MKILFVHKDLNQDLSAGGINTVYLKHIEILQNTDNELFVITSREGKWNLKAKRYIVSDDKTLRINEIEKIINEIKPDIIDVFSWNAELLDYVKKPHYSKVIMRADIPMKFYGKEPIDEEMAVHCDKVISISTWCDFEWSSVLGSKTHIIPHACDIIHSQICNKKKNSVVWVGKSTHIKGFDLLFKLPDKFFKTFDLTVISVPTTYSSEEAFNILINKGVTIKQRISKNKYNNILSKSEYVLSTARKEGFCIAVLEAMNYGCIPVIPYWIGGTTDFVNEENGIIYTDFNDCFNKMNKNNSIKKEKAVTDSKHYNWVRIVNESIKVYKELKDEK